MLLLVPFCAVTAGLGVIALFSLFIPPSLDALPFSQELMNSDSLILALLGVVLYIAQRIDILLFTLYGKAFMLMLNLMPFASLWLLWKLFTL